MKRFTIITLFVTLLLIAYGGFMGQYEQPKYSVLQSSSNIEIRQYEPKLVAETVVSGERRQAADSAFAILGEYIFGQNTSATAIAMTAPVTQSQQSEKIAMTVPVTQTGNQTAWVVQFAMPSKYTTATLPRPKNPRITIKQVPGAKVAAIRFSGFAEPNQLRENEAKLRSYLSQQGIEPKGEATYAFYDGPFTLPMFRRNEVMLELG
ncbi:MAG: heme-binding protein [Leptolyngbyaceae cyanobacterium SL_5_9]|nr:heme-binding protein [Leptolyngbyaceae cyanobacterium SL_5_9]